MLESTPYLLKVVSWTADLSPHLSTTDSCWKAVEMSAQQVGVPPTKRRALLVACVRNHPSAEERLIRWKARLTNTRVQSVSLGEFVGCKGSYFLNRKQTERGIFSFEDPILSLTRGRVLGEKLPPSGYPPHPSDELLLEDAQELHLADSAKVATALEGYVFPPTLNRSTIATLLVDSTPGGMVRAVVICFLATGVLPKDLTCPPDWEQKGLSCEALDNIRKTDRRIDETPIQEELQNLTTESGLDPIIAPVVTRKGKQRMLQSGHPLPLQASRPPPPTGPPGEMPPPPPSVILPPRTRIRKQKDQGTLDPMFPTRVIATSVDTTLSQGDHRGSYPTMLQRTADLLRELQELTRQHRGDSHLVGKIQDLDNGRTGGEYVVDNIGLLWYAPQGSILRLAIPRSLVPGILALVRTTCGHPGVTRTTELVQRKYYRTSLKNDVRGYVRSCGCPKD